MRECARFKIHHEGITVRLLWDSGLVREEHGDSWTTHSQIELTSPAPEPEYNLTLFRWLVRSRSFSEIIYRILELLR